MSFLRKRGSTWYYYFYNRDKKRVERESLRTKDESTAKKRKKIKDAEQTLNLKPSELVKPSDHQYKLSDVLNIFLTDKQPAQTKKAYKLAVNHFISAAGDKYLYQYKKQDYLLFVHYLNNRIISRNSKANYTRHLNVFFNWMVKYKFIRENIIEIIKPELKEVKIIPNEDLQTIFEYIRDPVKFRKLHPDKVKSSGQEKFIEQSWRKEQREKINKIRFDLIKLKYLGAYRASETLHISREDFDLKNDIIYIRNSKGKRIDSIPMVKDLKEHIQQINFNGTAEVFHYHAYSGIRSFWDRAMADLGFNYTLHQLRKTRGTELAEKGVNPFFLKKFMRHTSLTTTDQYYIKINIANAKEDINKRL